MPRYLISIDAHAMDHIPDEDMPPVTNASLPVVQATASADYYRTNEHLRTLFTQLSTAVRYGGPDYGNTPWTGEAEGKLLFSQPVVEVVNGKKSVDQALADMTAALKTLAKQ